MTKNIFGTLIPQLVIIIWAAYELCIGLTQNNTSTVIISSIVILIFSIISINALVKVVKHPNDPTYLKKNKK